MTKARSNATAPAAKGQIVVGTGTDASGILSVGNAGETLVADSSASTGLRYQEPKAGNPIINSAFQVWQRNTSFSLAASTGTTYTADRWMTFTGANQACTISRQTTSDTTNLPFIQFALRYARNSGQTGTGGLWLTQSFESINSIPFAGKTVTLSFYARRGANYSAASNLLDVYLVSGTGTDQNYISGYTGNNNVIGSNATLTTTWQRFTYTGTIPSTATELSPLFVFNPTGTAGANDWYEITGVQLEAGSVATPFRTQGVTLAGELAACQRYYYRINGNGSNGPWAIGYYYGTATAGAVWTLPVVMRTTPTFTPSSGTIATIYNNSSGGASTAITDNGGNNHTAFINFARTGVANTPASITFASGYLEWSSEL